MNSLKIAYFYPDQLNLYGDNGNIEILTYRAKERGIQVDVLNVTPITRLDFDIMSQVNLIFMGGGPDAEQKIVYRDLIEHTGKYIDRFVNGGGVGLFICGSYQLLGHYYKSADGTVLKGLGIFDLYTEHFGNHRPRCIGNTLARVEEALAKDGTFRMVNHLGSEIVGFENHGGRTYLGKGAQPFAKILKGNGNNSEDETEGIMYKNSIGTYFHGPLLARNPHIADYMIAKALNILDLKELDDDLIIAAHTASKNLK